MVRRQNINFQRAGIFSPDSKTLEDQNMRAFLFQSDKARVRSTLTDFPCPPDPFAHCFVCKFRDIRPLGITVLLLVGRLHGGNFFLLQKEIKLCLNKAVYWTKAVSFCTCAHFLSLALASPGDASSTSVFLYQFSSLT